MTEESKPVEVTETSVRLTLACDIAIGIAVPDPDETGTRIQAAHKYLNAKGKGPWWYRMVYRNDSWEYFSEDRLPAGVFLASDRRATVYGDVFIGELVCQHDRGSKVDVISLIAADVAGGIDLLDVPFCTSRNGQLVLTLPDGRKMTVPNPRK